MPTMDPEHLLADENRCPTLGLPMDVVLTMLDHLPLPSHFDSASTYKAFAIASQPALKFHQNAYTKYRVASGLNLSTASLLLRSTFGEGDSGIGAHPRSGEAERPGLKGKHTICRGHWRITEAARLHSSKCGRPMSGTTSSGFATKQATT